mmetsp:Transcript_103269/g.267011  ORF Transcript_103269/g.267011 Transcript_103269/m.267011 type:complete len:117 (-) Transcript_103269:718-1068(-)
MTMAERQVDQRWHVIMWPTCILNLMLGPLAQQFATQREVAHLRCGSEKLNFSKDATLAQDLEDTRCSRLACGIQEIAQRCTHLRWCPSLVHNEPLSCLPTTPRQRSVCAGVTISLV